MRVPHPRHLALFRNRVISVRAVADLGSRLDELETGVPEHLRQARALHDLLDGLEREVMSLVASRLGDRGVGPGGE